MSRHNAGEQVVPNQKAVPVSALPPHDPKQQTFTQLLIVKV